MKPPGFRCLICSCAFMLLLCTWPLPAVTDASTQSPRNTQGITESNNKGALPDLSANKSNNSARGVIHNTSTDGTVISTTTGSDGIINGTTGSTASSASNANSTTRSTPSSAPSANSTTGSTPSSASSANSTTGSTPSSAPSTTYNTTITSEGSSNSSSINNGNSTIKDNVTDSPQCPEMCSCPQYEAWASYLVPYLRQRLGPKANKHTDYVMKLFLLQEFVHNAEPIKSILGELFERVQSEGDAQKILSLWWTRFGITRCYLVETTFYLDAAAEAVLFPQVQFKQSQRNLLAKNQGTPTENKTVEDRLDNYQLYNITFVCKNGSKVVVTKEASLFRYGQWSSIGCDVSTEGPLTLHRNWSLISLEMTNENGLWLQNITVPDAKDGAASERLDDKKNQFTVQLRNDSISNNSLQIPHLKKDTVFPSIQYISIKNTTLSLQQLGQVLVWFQKAHELGLRNNSLANFNCSQLIPSPAAWNTLVISVSGLTSVPACILRTSLVTLDLSMNSISNISVFQFPKYVPSPNLKSLTLSSNNIKDVGMFTDLLNLEFLYLADNKISFLNKMSLTRLPNLSVLDLSRNQLHKLDPGTFKSFNFIQFLDLRYNYLLHFDRTVSPLKMGTVLKCKIYLSHNRFSHPPFQSDSYDPGPLIFVYASDNPFACDCAMPDYIDATNNSSLTAIYLERSDMQCAYPPYLKGVHLDDIVFTDSCPVVAHCPPGCTCNLSHNDSIITVDCTDVHHFQSPAKFPEDHQLRLEFQSVNKTQTFTAFQDSEYLQRVISLNFSGRGLTYIPEFMCEALKQAQVLDLTFNKLQRLPSCFQSRPESWPTLEMRLAHNPWSCDCDAVDLSSWLAEMKNGTAKNGVRVSDAMDVRCSAETDPGVRVAEWDSSGCTPVNYLPWALTLGVMLALAAVLGPLIYVYRLQAMVTIHDRFHIRPFTRTVHYNEEDFDHEVLVVHGTSDAGLDWVRNTLIPRAQDTHHRLCLPDRDFLLGSPLAETYASSVARAKATLCLLSQDVTDDEWWRYAFQLARAENARSTHRKFLLVLLDRVDVAKQPEEVREFVKTNTYLSVKDPMFWKKLFFYLPDPPRTAL